ncbi:MAG: universal stress protein [Isosphaeraceae bacterium]
MKTPRTILFAADFSEDSIEAFRVACSLASRDETLMIVYHVIDTDRDAEARSSPSVQALEAAREQQMREVYVPDRPIELGYRTSVGPASAEILRTAAEVRADLIAMGTHGRTRLQRMLTGSVAMDVLKKARCAVLVLRGQSGVPRTGDIRVILHPTDFSEASEASLDVAQTLARDAGARLAVIHVVPVDLYLEGSMAPEIDPWDYQHSLHVIRKRLEGANLKHPVETMLGRGHPADEILRAADDLGCDLIVMGTHGFTGLGHLLMGNVAEVVLPRASCPVLLVKPSEQETRPTEAEFLPEAQSLT